jgi:hypothetical protein
VCGGGVGGGALGPVLHDTPHIEGGSENERALASARAHATYIQPEDKAHHQGLAQGQGVPSHLPAEGAVNSIVSTQGIRTASKAMAASDTFRGGGSTGLTGGGGGLCPGASPPLPLTMTRTPARRYPATPTLHTATTSPPYMSIRVHSSTPWLNARATSLTLDSATPCRPSSTKYATLRAMDTNWRTRQMAKAHW